MSKSCTKRILKDFIVLKFSFSCMNMVCSNLFKKRKLIVLYIGFHIQKRVSFQKRELSIFVSAIEIVHLWQNLRTFIVPYICLSEKRCSKDENFHSFESECFCQSLGETRTWCLCPRVLDIVCELRCN